MVFPELQSIVKEILEAGRSNEEWAKLESDDMFQTDTFCGGYDADEEAFCFSYYAEDGREYWFQLTLQEIAAAATGDLKEIRPAE